ncbi:MAG TPA: hypothetical protein VKB09_16370 [Thermomicrobiales bacterium]|nr:hypothetical protein [Thermomicrobiales bacterium]
MDGNRFDNIARSLAEASSRRGIVRAIATGAATLGAMLLHGPEAGAAAQQPRTPRRRRCRVGYRCQAGEICQDGYCFSC